MQSSASNLAQNHDQITRPLQRLCPSAMPQLMTNANQGDCFSHLSCGRFLWKALPTLRSYIDVELEASLFIAPWPYQCRRTLILNPI